MKAGRHYLGYDIQEDYLQLARERINARRESGDRKNNPD
jgi:DNA modification methylase